jgi:hypothetical protein
MGLIAPLGEWCGRASGTLRTIPGSQLIVYPILWILVLSPSCGDASAVALP